MNDLMTLASIAEMAHCSMRHARDVLVRLPGFPEEAPLSTPRNRLWLRSEVRAYVHRKPAKLAQIPHIRLQAA
jgi:hypothetical protein